MPSLVSPLGREPMREQKMNNPIVFISVIINCEQYTEFNLDAQHGILSPSFHKNVCEMFSDAGHVCIK